MPAYVIVEIDILDPAGYEEYKKLAGATVEKYGGKYIVRGGRTEVLEGDWKPKRIVVLQFDSAAACQRVAEQRRISRAAQNAASHSQDKHDPRRECLPRRSRAGGVIGPVIRTGLLHVKPNERPTSFAANRFFVAKAGLDCRRVGNRY